MSKQVFLEKKVKCMAGPIPRFKVKTLSLLTGGVICAALLPPNSYAELPDPCRGGCGPAGNLSFVQAGAAAYNTTNNTMTVTQTTDKAVLNWNSFNVSENAAVNFAQKNASSVALNRIFSATPSKILGNVTANGQIYLINPSGILFGKNAKVNVGGLVASTLNVDTDTFMNSGIANALAAKDQSGRVTKDDYAAFRNKNGEWGEHDASEKIVVEEGATIKTQGAGNVALVGKTVENNGSIEASDGQVLLIAAEDRVYLQPSDDLALRGFLVEVDTGGTVTNTGEVKAERGNVTLAGHTVNQRGVVKATTSLDRNGSIYLQAREGGDVIAGAGGAKNTLTAAKGGALTVGENSLTSIELELDSLDKAIDDQEPIQSRVKLAGKTIHIGEEALIKAHNGIVDVVASSTPNLPFQSPDGKVAARDDTAYIQVDRGASIDVQGADATLEMSRNFVTLELFSSELKDAPLQRNGILRGEEVTVDIRKGTPLADISAALAAVPKSLAERASRGGAVNLVSQGAVLLHESSSIDVSGGEVTYEGGFVSTTQLLSNGRIIDISEADPSLVYDGILGVYTKVDRENGVIYREGRPTAKRFWESGYKAGSAAGTVTIAGYNMQIEGDIVSHTVTGRYQSTPETRPAGGTLNIGLPREFNSFTDNLAPSLMLQAGHAGEQAANVQLAAVELEFRMTLANHLLSADPALTEDELADAIRAQLETSDVKAQLKAAYLARMGENNEAHINIDKLADAGLQTLNINSNGTITVAAADTALRLDDSAHLSLRGQRIVVDRSISSAGGTLSLRSQSEIANSVQINETSLAEGLANVEGITLADGVMLDVSGEYANDIDRVRLPEDRLLAIDAGNISLSVSSNEALSLGSNVGLLAEGGLYVDRKGGIDSGRGGAISLDASATNAFFSFSEQPLDAEETISASRGLTLSARGLEDNGTLTLAAGGFFISDADQFKADAENESVRISSADATGLMSRRDLGLQGNRLSLSSAFFEDGAFSDYRLGATEGDVIIDADTQIDLVQRNFVMTSQAIDVEAADAVRGLSTIETLDSRLRHNVDLSIAQKTIFDRDLVIGTGASITTEAGGKLALSNGSGLGGARILMDGKLQADAGSISLTLTREQSTAPVNNASMIWLGEHAQLSAQGVFDQDYNDNPADSPLGKLVTGDVLAGGKIDIKATGFVVMQDGALIDVSGTHAEVDVFVGNRRTTSEPYQHRLIASAAGQVNLTAGEGMVLAGEFRANSDGVSSSTSASALSLQSTFADRSVTNDSGVAPSLVDPARQIQFLANGKGELPDAFLTVLDSDANAVSPGALASGYRGQTVVNAAEISAAFDNLVVNTDGVVSFGAAGDNSPVNLSFDRSLKIDSQYLKINAADGGSTSVNLAAHDVVLGSANPVQGVGINGTRIPQAGTGELTIDASAIDIRNSLYVDGIDSLQMNAAGDIRLIDVGTVSSTGKMALNARQVVATTAADMKLQALDITSGEHAQSGRIIISSNGSAAAPVLAAQGKVTLTAATIEQNGVLLAPFGAITLDAIHLQSDGKAITAGAEGLLRLGEASVTSVSLNGQSVPYGNTLNGLEWGYGINNNKVFTDSEQNVFSPAISLQGNAVDIVTGAAIDISGGGDLLAYEYVTGLGGSKDYLDIIADGPDANVERYAILPALGNTSVPFDQKYSATAGAPDAGQTIVIGAGSALPAGEYLLLPAQYGLLPGAYIIEKVDGYRDVAGLRSFALLDGTPVVAGYESVAGLDVLATRADGYSVRPGSAARQFSEYRETSANQFFTERAKLLDLAIIPSRPLDAALLGIAAGESLRLDGSINGSAAEGGRGSALDISADRLQVVASVNDVEADGSVVLTAEQLANLEVGSLLLGGRRTTTATGMSISVLADSVSIKQGAQVVGDEIVLVATDKVSVEQNAALLSQTTANNERMALDIDHGGAVVAVSHRLISEVNRTGTETGSSIDVADNARLSSANSLVLDSTGTTLFAGAIDAPGAVHLGASRVELGYVAGDGLVLSQSTLQGLAGVDLLGIQASEQMLLADGVNVSADALRLTTPHLSGALSASGQTRIEADTLTLAGGNTEASVASGQGTITVDVGTLNLANGHFALGNIDTLQVFAQNALTFSDDGKTHIAAHSVTMATPLVVAEDGITSALSVDGELSFVSTGDAGEVAAGIGAKVDVSAASLRVDNQWRMESGLLSLNATEGNVTLGDHAQLDVSGREFRVYETSLYSDAGQILLSAEQGDIEIQSGARLDIAASSGGGDAGSLWLRAAEGDINMAGSLLADAAHGRSGRLGVDAQHYNGGLDALAALMQSSNAHGALDIRLRTDQRQVLSAGAVISADSIELAFDHADVDVFGELNASGLRGGDISIFANGDVVLGNTSRLVSRGGSDRGGSVLVSAHEGELRFAEGAMIDVSGAEGGDVVLRADIDEARGVNIDDDGFAGTITGARRARLEVHDTPYNDSGEFTQADADALLERAQAIQASASALRNRLNLGDATDIASALDVVVNGTGVVNGAGVNDYIWRQEVNLDDWQIFTEEGTLAEGSVAPGTLTVRASGQLTMARSLSDGFNAEGVLTDKDGWSFRLVAGADNTAANAMETNAASGADLRVGDPLAANRAVRVRTGNGNIQMAAARDFILLNNRAAVYSGGRDIGLALDRFNVLNGTLAGEKMVSGEGGNVSIVAGRDVIGQQNSTSGVLAWAHWLKDNDATPEKLVYDDITGEPIIDPETGHYLYEFVREDAGRYVDFSAFSQGLAAFGGGSSNISAGRDVVRIDMALPTLARIDSITGDVTELGHGNLSVLAAGDVISSNFLMGEGRGKVVAQGSIRAGRTVNGNSVAGYSALMGGELNYVARKDLALLGAFDPLAVNRRYFGGTENLTKYYFSFDDNTAFSAYSIAGDSDFQTNLTAVQVGLFGTQTTKLFSEGAGTNQGMLVPSDFVLASFAGNTSVSSVVSFVQDDSRFIAWAGGDLSLTGVSSLIDLALADLPGIANEVEGRASAFDPLVGVNIRSVSPLEAENAEVLLAGVEGDVSIPSLFKSAVPVDIFAGKDIEALQLATTHYNESDVTRVSAGRDIKLTSSFEKIHVAGPGRVEVMAGRDVNLGSSLGIETVGATTNTQLQGRYGADVFVYAGVQAEDLQYNSFIAPLLDNASNLDIFAFEVQTYVNDVTHENLSQRDAAERFRTLSLEQQKAFTSNVAGANEQVNAMLSALAYADAMSDTISRSGAYPLLLANLQQSTAGVSALVESYRLHEGSAASAEEAIALLPSLTQKDQQDVLHYGLALLDESMRRDLIIETFSALSASDQRPLISHAFFNELSMSGRNANAGAPVGFDRGYQAADAFFSTTSYQGDKKMTASTQGNLSLLLSKVYTLDGGDINLLVPGGYVNAGVVTPPLGGVDKKAFELGIVAQGAGNVSAYLQGNFLVNQSRVFTLQEGNIAIWSSAGNIDAGRGAKTAVAAPAPTLSLDANGNVVINIAGAVAGSGIRQIDTTGEDDAFEAALKARTHGSFVNLFAPVGEINAGEAGIGAVGFIDIGGERVIGADNIDIGAGAVGLPLADTGGFSGGLVGSDGASSAVNKASEEVADDVGSDSPQADEALSWLEVTFAGFGDESADSFELKAKRKKDDG